MQWFGSKQEAIDSGEEEKDLVTLHYRNKREKDALELAAAHGNRTTRRTRKFRPHLYYATTEPLAGGALTPEERNKRNAARRLAKQQRKRNKR